MAKTYNIEQVRVPISIEAWRSINFSSLSDEERELKCQVMFNRSYEEAKNDVEIPWLVNALKTKNCAMVSWESNQNIGETAPIIEMHFTAYEVHMASFAFMIQKLRTNMVLEDENTHLEQ